MDKINWKVRIKSKAFWLALIPALLVLAQTIAVPFGYQFDFANLGNQLTGIVNAVFVVMSILGIVVDPTTSGVKDTTNVMEYKEPRKEGK